MTDKLEFITKIGDIVKVITVKDYNNNNNYSLDVVGEEDSKFRVLITCKEWCYEFTKIRKNVLKAPFIRMQFTARIKLEEDSEPLLQLYFDKSPKEDNRYKMKVL